MRDQYFPRDMRSPTLSVEFNQLAAYSALRLITLKVNTVQLNAHCLAHQLRMRDNSFLFDNKIILL